MISLYNYKTDKEASENLWNICIVKNQPLILKSSEKDSSCFWAKGLTLETLITLSGKETVYVEKIDKRSGSFGHGVRFRTTFFEFSQTLKKQGESQGESQVYLSTQPIADDPKTGLPLHLVAPPLSSALSLFELRPIITEKLVPANINLWIGSSRSGSSSGLHHDFHSNLYTLLRGKKRFTIAAPSSYNAMYLNGKVLKVHPNGLINYIGAETLEDGRPISTDPTVDGKDDEEEEDAAEVDAMWAAITDASFTRLKATATTSRKRMRDKETNDTSCSTTDKKHNPDHFSQIPLAEFRKKVRNLHISSPLSPEETLVAIQSLPEVQSRFPLFSKAKLYTFELNAGDCLFLPQGWFHEVESIGDEDGDIHMALNHWFWPTVRGERRQMPYGKDAGAFFEAAYKKLVKKHNK
jgi:hypothetical protein